MLPVKLWFINVYTHHNPKPSPYSNANTVIMCYIRGCGYKGYSYRKPTINIFFYLLDCVLLTSTPTPTLNLPLTVMQMH